jgi:hypothetical protein
VRAFSGVKRLTYSDLADEVLVKLGKFFGRHPKFLVNPGANDFSWVPSRRISFDLKYGHKTGARRLHVPIARNLNGVPFVS